MDTRPCERAPHDPPVAAGNPQGVTHEFRNGVILWFVVAGAFALLYGGTCQRGCSWDDAGWYQWRVEKGLYNSDSGLCTVHPLYIALGRLWTTALWGGDTSTGLNAFSGIAMAIALGNLAVLLWRLTQHRAVSMLMPVLLGVCHTPWWLSTMAEIYTLQLACFTVELLLLERLIAKPRVATLLFLAWVNGLGVGIHNLALLALPIYAAVTISCIREKLLPLWVIPLCGLAFGIGASPLIALVAGAIGENAGVSDAIASALWGDWKYAVLNTRLTSRVMLMNMGLIGLNLANIIVPLAVFGLFRIWRSGKKRLWALGGLLIIHTVFLIRYNVPDMFTFALPALALFAVMAGYGAADIARRSATGRNAVLWGLGASILISPLLCRLLPSMIKPLVGPIQRNDVRPGRDELSYLLWPWKHNEHSAKLFGKAALDIAAPNGIIITGFNSLYPLLLEREQREEWRGVIPYKIEKGKRNAIEALHAASDEQKVFAVCPWILGELQAAVELETEGVLYRIKGTKKPVAPTLEGER